MKNIHSLFPEPLGNYDLHRNITSTELSCLKEQDWNESTFNYASIDKNVLDKKNLASLREFIENSLNDYSSKIYQFDDDTELYLTQSWVNITLPGGRHHRHSHPNSIVSGTFYFSGNDTDQIQFEHPGRETGQSWFFPPKEYHEYNCYSWLMPAPIGKLYIWNSTVSHSVPLLEGKNNRYSLSFNTFVRGNLTNGGWTNSFQDRSL
tara:strand:- start:64 stop:681 length:618 start_codon:yes stop_codon:yes gene_type:complete